MRMTKKTLRFFTIADWEKDEINLRKMHNDKKAGNSKKVALFIILKDVSRRMSSINWITIKRGAKIKGHMCRCLRTVVGNTSRILLDIPILEKHKIQWAKTKKPYFVMINQDCVASYVGE